MRSVPVSTAGRNSPGPAPLALRPAPARPPATRSSPLCCSCCFLSQDEIAYQAVPSPMHGLYFEPERADYLAQFVDHDVDALVGVVRLVVAPHRFDDQILGDRPRRTAQQQREKLQ